MARCFQLCSGTMTDDSRQVLGMFPAASSFTKHRDVSGRVCGDKTVREPESSEHFSV